MKSIGTYAFSGVAAVALVALGTSASAQVETVSIPTVRCPLQTMTGAESVKAPATVSARVSKPYAGQISYYTVGYVGAFGPRGWHCSGQAGSSGVVLLAGPNKAPTLVNPGQIALQAALYSGDTSGRFSVLETGAPLFANLRALVKKVTATFGQPIQHSQPIPGQKVTPVSANVASFVDPPKVQGAAAASGGGYTAWGVATELWPKSGAGSDPVIPDLRVFSIAVPASQSGLAQTLVALNGGSP
jgi:hypothetical protein